MGFLVWILACEALVCEILGLRVGVGREARCAALQGEISVTFSDARNIHVVIAMGIGCTWVIDYEEGK
jgi:hypothetical protein